MLASAWDPYKNSLMSKLIIFGGKELPFFTSWGPEANSIIMIVTAIVLLLLVPFCLPRRVDLVVLVGRINEYVRTSWINFLHGRIWKMWMMQ